MINRVTQQTVQRSTLANLQVNLAKMSDLQARMSGGKVITKPSDDPAGMASALSLRADVRATEQYQRNAADGLAWLTVADTAMSTVSSQLRRARDLTVQGGSGALNAPGREALAVEIEGIRDTMLAQANTTHLGRTVFAGTSDAGVAFTDGAAVPPYDWTGTAGAGVQRRLTADTTVRVDADGSAVFGTGAASVFALLDSIAADLRAGVSVSGRLTEIDTRMTAVLTEQAAVGTRYNQVKAAQSTTAITLQTLTGQLSAIEDVDLAATIVELQMQEVAYQGALGATSRVLQPTLMDFLR